MIWAVITLAPLALFGALSLIALGVNWGSTRSRRPTSMQQALRQAAASEEDLLPVGSTVYFDAGYSNSRPLGTKHGEIVAKGPGKDFVTIRSDKTNPDGVALWTISVYKVTVDPASLT